MIGGPTRRTRITLTDVCIGLFIAAGVAYLAYRIKTGVHYKWNWDAMFQFFFRFDDARGKWVPNTLMQGFFTTIRLSLWAGILAVVIGAVMGLFRTSNSLFKRLLGGSFVELVRNMPPLVLVLIFYFFISSQITPVLGLDDFVRERSETVQAWIGFFFADPARFSNFLSALIALGIFEGAYMTEIIRAGIQSVEKGQWEASDALGFSRYQRMRHVILPQALRRILPPLAGQFISTIKDSAIVSVISVQELTFQGMELMAATYLTFEIWITVTVMYLALTLCCSLAVGRIEVALRR